MTHAAALFLDGHRSGPRPPRYPDARRRWSRAGKEAAFAILSIAWSFGALMSALPPTPTPGNVASVFLESWFLTEGSPARGLLCASNRATAEPMFVSHQLVDLDQRHVLPHVVDVHVDEVRATRGSSGPFFTVTVTATADGRGWVDWSFVADVPLVREDGELRVCFPQHAAAT